MKSNHGEEDLVRINKFFWDMNQYREYFSTGAGLCVDPNSLLLKQLEHRENNKIIIIYILSYYLDRFL